jgi:Uma2 family endonuclease
VDDRSATVRLWCIVAGWNGEEDHGDHGNHGRRRLHEGRPRRPAGGYRHELIDGAFFVSPAPGLSHQTVVLKLGNKLSEVAESVGLGVVIAPFDVVLGEFTVVEPDILVAPESAFSKRDLSSPPLLAVEVRLPSTARVDRLLKRDVYERAGVVAYWLVDPRTRSVTVLELEAGGYIERGSASGDETLPVEQPFPMDLTPSQWVPPA